MIIFRGVRFARRNDAPRTWEQATRSQTWTSKRTGRKTTSIETTKIADTSRYVSKDRIHWATTYQATRRAS